MAKITAFSHYFHVLGNSILLFQPSNAIEDVLIQPHYYQHTAIRL